MNITREYFNKVEKACKALEEFAAEYTSGTKNECVIFLACDMLKCLERMGHSYRLSCPQSIGLFQLMSGYTLKYDLLDETIRDSGDEFETIIGELKESVYEGPSSEFMVLEKLNSDDLYPKMEYLDLVYNLAHILAMQDGNIGGKEFLFLNELLTRYKSLVDEVERMTRQEAVPSGEAYMKELDELIGLAGVKNDIHTLANFARVQGMRKAKGLKTTPLSLHCVFSGNPGTGKTTVARILGKIYKDLGLIKSGKLVETDRSGLVGEYIGSTAIKTNAVIDSALDGILFIDEAYTLVSSGQNDFGKEAITTLLKRMEDDRDRLIVILAGYSENMEEFLATNPGLSSRFSRRIFFEDYSEGELVQIFKSNLKKFDYTITPDAVEALHRKIGAVLANKPADFGNARYVRNIFEQVLQIQANRVSRLPHVTTAQLCNIEAEDIEKLA